MTARPVDAVSAAGPVVGPVGSPAARDWGYRCGECRAAAVCDARSACVGDLVQELDAARAERDFALQGRNAWQAEAERDAAELAAARRVIQAAIEWVTTFDCDCFGGSYDQDAERCDRCEMLDRFAAALADPVGLPTTDEPATESSDEAAYWFMARHDQHDVGTRHEDGALFSATCHDCDETFRRGPGPTPEPATTERPTFDALLADPATHVWIRQHGSPEVRRTYAELDRMLAEWRDAPSGTASVPPRPGPTDDPPAAEQPTTCEHGSTMPHVDKSFLVDGEIRCPGPTDDERPATGEQGGMSIHRDCGGCMAGDHERHDGRHSGPSGLIGGTYCGCTGDCAERFAAFRDQFARMFPVAAASPTEPPTPEDGER